MYVHMETSFIANFTYSFPLSNIHTILRIVKLKLVSAHSYVHLLLLISAQRACKKIIEFQWYLLFHFKYFDTWIPKMQDDGKMRNF